ncbi:MAG: PilZ domain-containing protein [Nitrospirae bacterium]|nr:PilZ domain-containing protein [Nitrospirota bacterium]
MHTNKECGIENIENRESPRVDVVIPFEASLVPASEKENIRSRKAGWSMPAEYQTMAEIEDKLLSDWLKMLNIKLDLIINMMALTKEGMSSLPPSRLNISGTGLSFSAVNGFSVGDIVELKLLLPLMPPVALLIYGEVVCCDKESGISKTAVKFINIDEEITDEIVKFIFKTEKEILRDKRR